MRVKMELEDIEKGEKQNTRYCPIGQAITRLFPDFVPLVGYRTVLNRTDGLTYKLSKEAQKFVLAFDHHQSVEPITFEMELIHSRRERES